MMTQEELREFFAPIIAWFGYDPAFALAFWSEQARGENTTAAYNPLATKQKMDGDSQFNPEGVRAYASAASGQQATIWTIDPNIYNGVDYYPHVRRALAERSIDAAGRNDVAREVALWGTHSFANDIAAGWNPTIEPAPEPAPEPEPVPAPEPEPAPPLPGNDSEAWRYVDALNAAVLRRNAKLAEAFRAVADALTAPDEG